MTKKQFEDYFTEFQTNMVAICLEYVKHRADNIYIVHTNLKCILLMCSLELMEILCINTN